MASLEHELAGVLIKRFGDIFDTLEGLRFETANESVLFTGTLMKLQWHGLSALKLCEEPFHQDFPDHRDFSSVSVLARAALESSGIFKYIFHEIAEVDKWFLLDYMELCGLMFRNQIEPIEEENIEKQQREGRRIEELKTLLSEHQLYKELRDKDQKRILEGTWKPFDKSDIPDILGMGPKSQQTTYKYLSDYVHNGYVAALQVSQPQESARMAEIALTTIAMSLAFTVQSLSQTFEAVKVYLNDNQEVKRAVDLYLAFGER